MPARRALNPQRRPKPRVKPQRVLAPPNLRNLIAAELRASATQRSRRPPAAKPRRTGPARPGARDMLTAKGSARNGSNGNKQRMIISEREYIGEIIPSAYPAFSLQQYPVNPGQAACFPWLSSIARNFEKYEFESLAFVYKREVSEYAANGQTGKVVMSFDSDATDPAPTTKQQLEDCKPNQDCMPCENMRLVVPKALLKRFNDAHYVRPGAQPANTDLKTYDVGVLNVCCQGTAANTAVGELHVEYTVRVMIPILIAAIGAGTLQGAGGSLAAATPFGAVPVSTGFYALAKSVANALVLVASGLTVGVEYELSSYILGTVITGFHLSAVTGTTAVSTVGDTINAAATAASQVYTFVATAAAATFTFAVTATTVTASAVVLTALVPTPGF
jgi:hypothetical protein